MKIRLCHNIFLLCLFCGGCVHTSQIVKGDLEQPAPRVKTATPLSRPLLTGDKIRLDTALRYDRYTLADTYTYQKKKRDFNWEQIRNLLAFVENMQDDTTRWIVLQNYKNRNGQAPLVGRYARNVYGNIADTAGVERYQSVPLFRPDDTLTAVVYGRDGSIAHLESCDSLHCRIFNPIDSQRWLVPQCYVKILDRHTRFEHVIVIDRKDQNITTLERLRRGRWVIRSKNPATTGRQRPPYAKATPLGMFLLQETKRKMLYLKDGSDSLGGFAPYAMRFTNGAYIHGVPVAVPQKEEIEYSWSLGTTPRSHMCVRNATSHSKFIYEWAPVERTLVVVLE